MKLVNVNVILQYDIEDVDVTEEMVEDYINELNETLKGIGDNTEPQLYFNNDSKIEVVELDEES